MSHSCWDSNIFLNNNYFLFKNVRKKKKSLFPTITSFLLQVNICCPSADFVPSSFLPHCLNVFILPGRLLRNSLCSPVAQWWCWDHSFWEGSHDESVHADSLAVAHAQFCSRMRLDRRKVMFPSPEKLLETKIDTEMFFYTVFLHVVAARDCGFDFPVLKFFFFFMPSGTKLIFHVIFL